MDQQALVKHYFKMADGDRKKVKKTKQHLFTFLLSHIVNKEHSKISIEWENYREAAASHFLTKKKQSQTSLLSSEP